MLIRLTFRSVSAALFAAVMFTVGCATPLGPGYGFALRRSEISSVPAEPAHIHVRVSDTLQNVGNRDLSFLDIAPPFPGARAVTGLTVRVAGVDAHTLGANGDSDRTVRVRFATTWPQGQQRYVVFDYDVAAQSSSPLSAVAADGFYLAGPAAFPQWSPPPGPFADGDLRAVDERLQVSVPSDWFVLGPGSATHKALPEGLSLWEFRTQSEDIAAFIIAGRFQESRIRTGRGVVIIWALGQLNSEAARVAAERISAAAAAYEDVFGPLPTGVRAIRIVEMPGGVPPESRAASPVGSSFPGGALLNRKAFAQGLDNEAVMQLAERELARTWLGWRVRPRAKSQLGLGAAWFPLVLSAERRGGAVARQRLVAQLIEAYDSSSRGSHAGMSTQGPASASSLPVAEEQHAALFCVALEDLAGKEKFARAMREIVRIMDGHEVGDEELRSALEAETGLNLAGTFRMWLHQPGLSADFRARYVLKQ